MTLLIFFLGALFTISALWLTIAPFVGAERGLRFEHLDEEVREIELLVARRQVLLTSLRELDFDFETDKIAREDYERFRRRYEAEAVAIMRRLDEIHGGRDWQLRVDQELTERLGHAPQITGATGPTSDDEPDDESDEAEEPQGGDAPEEDTDDQSDIEVASSVVDLQVLTRLRCASCEATLTADDKFCSQCGNPVTPSESDEPATSEATP